MTHTEIANIKSAKKRTKVDGLLSASTEPKLKRGQLPQNWKPGQSGNPAGRAKGSRNKLQENAIAMLNKIFDEPNNEEKMRELRDNDYGTFLKCVVSLLPKQVEISETSMFEGMSEADLIAEISLTLRELKHVTKQETLQ